IPVMDATARLTFQLYGFVMADRDLAAMYADAWRYAQTIMLVGTKLVPTAALRLPGYRRAKAAVFRLIRGLLDAARAEHGQHTRLTILNALLDAPEQEGDRVGEAEMVSASLYGFVGTMVYMNRVVSFLLFELAKNPAVMNRAAREADGAFAEGP